MTYKLQKQAKIILKSEKRQLKKNLKDKTNYKFQIREVKNIKESINLLTTIDRELSLLKDFLKEKSKELHPTEFKYVGNEFFCIKVRREQIKNYFGKVILILKGKTIKDVEKEFKPITFETLKNSYKEKNGIPN